MNQIIQLNNRLQWFHVKSRGPAVGVQKSRGLDFLELDPDLAFSRNFNATKREEVAAPNVSLELELDAWTKASDDDFEAFVDSIE